MDEVEERIVGLAGQRYLDRFVATVAELAQIDCATVITLTRGSRSLRVIASSSSDLFPAGTEIALRGSAAAALLGGEGSPRIIADDAGTLLDGDAQVVATGAAGYGGVACRTRAGAVAGIVTLTKNSAFCEPELPALLLRRFAPRVALEIDRSRHAAAARRRENIRASIRLAADNGVWVWEPMRDLIHGSTRARAIAGVAVRRFDDFLAAIAESDRRRTAMTIMAAVSDGAPFKLECVVERHGETRTLELDAVPDRADGVLRYIGTIHDATARAAAADTLVILSRAVEHGADHVAVVDRAGTVQYMNAAWRAAAGDLVGHSVRALLGNQYVHAHVKTAVRGGKVFRTVFQKLSPSGALVFEHTAVSEVVDSAGGLNYVIVATDITDRVLAEETNASLHASLRKASDEWRVTVDAIATGIVLFDAHGTMLRMNRFARDLLGAGDYGAVGRNIAEMQLRGPWLLVLDLLREGGGHAGSITRQTVDPASARTWEVSVIRPDDSASAGVVALIVDITDRLRLEESVRRSLVMSAMGDLVAGVAHEVRNPIFGISATLDAFEASVGERSEFRPYTTMLRREVERLKVLTRDLLDYGRPASMELRPARLGQVLATAVELCASLAQKQNVIVANFVDTEFGECQADAAKLEHVFRNVIENAIQHSRSGDMVSICASRVQREGQPFLSCSVRDEGSGFREEDLPQIFQPFFSRRHGGTGLGLSIVHRSVEAHGGHVVASNADDGGAVVTIEIPVAEEHHAQ